ncbi:ABC transporter substrate-binding protein [bacterium]|nr:ABC transporter substrate-binding protein [bacterium]
MKRFRNWKLILISVALFWLPLGLYAEEGLTDTEIHIASWGPQTGPAAAWGSVSRAIDAYFKMINAEGGIHGRKVIYHHFDDAYNPAKTIAGVKQLQESSHGIFAWVVGVGTAPGMAVKDYLMERKTPWVGPATGSEVWTNPPNKYLFATYPYYFNEAQILVRYAAKTMNKKRIAIVYQNDEYGKSGLRGAEKELGKLGMELAAALPLNVMEKDLKPLIMELKNAQADTVLLWLTPSAAVRTVGTGKAMQFDTQWMSTSTCSDFPLLYKISRGVIEGMITGSFGLIADSDDPLLMKYKTDAFEKYAPKDERWGIFWYAGIGFMEPIVEGLKMAGRDLSREKLVAEMEKIEDFQGIFGKISYKPFDINDPKSRQGQHSVFLIQSIEDGKTKILTDWMTVD